MTVALEVCPSCGNFSSLREDSGFCNECSPGSFCDRCGKSFSPDQPNRKVCSSCREDLWLIKYADRLEELIGEGVPFSDAKRQVKKESKTICIGCGVPLSHHKGKLCTTNRKCRSVRIRARHNVVERGMDTDEALKEAMQRVYGRLIIFNVGS